MAGKPAPVYNGEAGGPRPWRDTPPEKEMTMPRIEIDASKCLGDGLCAEACVAHCLKLEDGRAVVLPQAERFCIACGHCDGRCPFHVNQSGRMTEIKEYFGE